MCVCVCVKVKRLPFSPHSSSPIGGENSFCMLILPLSSFPAAEPALSQHIIFPLSDLGNVIGVTFSHGWATLKHFLQRMRSQHPSLQHEIGIFCHSACSPLDQENPTIWKSQKPRLSHEAFLGIYKMGNVHFYGYFDFPVLWHHTFRTVSHKNRFMIVRKQIWVIAVHCMPIVMRDWFNCASCSPFKSRQDNIMHVEDHYCALSVPLASTRNSLHSP